MSRVTWRDCAPLSVQTKLAVDFPWQKPVSKKTEQFHEACLRSENKNFHFVNLTSCTYILLVFSAHVIHINLMKLNLLTSFSMAVAHCSSFFSLSVMFSWMRCSIPYTPCSSSTHRIFTSKLHCSISSLAEQACKESEENLLMPVVCVRYCWKCKRASFSVNLAMKGRKEGSQLWKKKVSISALPWTVDLLSDWTKMPVTFLWDIFVTTRASIHNFKFTTFVHNIVSPLTSGSEIDTRYCESCTSKANRFCCTEFKLEVLDFDSSAPLGRAFEVVGCEVWIGEWKEVCW